MATPCFFKRSASGLTRSRSAPGINWSASSTTVTSLPSARYTVAISRPMMPPPTTSSFFGISASSSASVESITRGSSHGKPGSFTACEPAAMMHCSKRSSCGLAVSTDRLPFRSAIRTSQRPVTTRTLRCLDMPARPLVSWPTTFVLVAAQLVERDLRLAEVDAEIRRMRGFVDHRRRMQQRLRRNAADVEADAAERGIAFDQHRIQAQIGGAERGGIAAGTGAEHDDAGIRCRPCGRWRPRLAAQVACGLGRRRRDTAASATRPASLAAGGAAAAGAAAAARLGVRGGFRFRGSRPPPSDSVSPTLTFNSFTTPAAVDGTSIVALSDSSVTRPWSLATVSPTATSTSITGTSS